ncbi:hypothetical protein MMC30_000669 [Trapelia coarctata]|nr:hypothetical protein [Trapelia coarctata]
MFSPDGPVGGSAATRNTRRRQRTSSDDSMTLRGSTKRRKRSLLAPDTFEPTTKHRRDTGTSQVNGKATANGYAPEDGKRRDASVDTTSLAIRNRGGKRADREKRVTKSADGVEQTKNDNYIVEKDPNIPEILRDILSTEQWHSEISSTLGHAVAMTHTKAIIWQYKQTTLAAAISKPFVVVLPQQPAKTPAPLHPLPLGMLVHDSGAGQIALLVIMPVSGQVNYWESAKRAEQGDHIRQKQNGLQGTVGGLMSGETITRVTEAEPDGFVLTTSNGRLVHLSVKDSQGRPSISTQFLRSNSASSGSFFGTITSVFSAASWRRDIAAVRAGPLRGKSHRPCVVATAQGVFQVWDLVRHSSKTLVFEADAKEELFRSIQKSSSRLFRDEFKNDLSIIDFAVFPSPDGPSSTKDSHRLLVLTHIKEGRIGTYSLVDLRIGEGDVEIEVVHPVNCFYGGLYDENRWNLLKPRVLVPNPAQTAFVFFDTSIVIVSLAQIEESPSSQLQLESHSLPDPFQDTLYLRQDVEYHVVACSAEDADNDNGKAKCVFLVHGFGMARVTALPAKEGQTASDRSAVTVKSKVEQAIFFGGRENNLLDFNPGRSQFKIEAHELEAATLEINDSIMRSTSSYIPALNLSMDDQLYKRAEALANLIHFTQRWTLKPLTRWQLLWSAEKMAAARAIWHYYNAELSVPTDGSKLLLPELLDMVSEKYKKLNRPERGEGDIVRHYLINDVWRIELVIPWCHHAVEELYGEGVRDSAKLARLISEADDIQIRAMEAAFSFRTANFSRYGFDPTQLVDGIYQGSYETLPEIWTSIPENVIKVKALADMSRDTALKNDTTPTDEEAGVDIELLKKLARDNPSLVHICCQVYEERCRWLQSRPDARSKAEGEALYRTYLQVRKDLIVKIDELGLPDEGIKLAEKYKDMQALVDVIEQNTAHSLDRLAEPGISDTEDEELQDRVTTNRGLLESYFRKYGDDWADVLYTKTISRGEIADLFENVGGFQEFLTRHLRKRPEYSKISWINEVLAEKDYSRAARNLMESYKHDTNLWSRKVELSMGKLALMAAEEKGPRDNAEVATQLRRADRRLAIIEIQDQLYEYIEPALRSALDESAKADIVLTEFGHNTKKRPTLRSFMQKTMKALTAREALPLDDLIDTLTLINMHTRHTQSEQQFADRRFLLALKLLKLSGLRSTDLDRYGLHEKTIWRRCMIQDKWEDINRTEGTTDAQVIAATSSTTLFRTLKSGFEDGYFEEAPPLAPTTVLNAGTTPASLRASSRYAESSDSFLRGLAHDLEKEDRQLEAALEKGRLDQWWPSIVEAAMISVRDDADKAGMESAERQEDMRDLAVAMGVVATEEANGYEYANGHMNGDAAMDEEGDVLMG